MSEGPGPPCVPVSDKVTNQLFSDKQIDERSVRTAAGRSAGLNTGADLLHTACTPLRTLLLLVGLVIRIFFSSCAFKTRVEALT